MEFVVEYVINLAQRLVFKMLQFEINLNILDRFFIDTCLV